MRILQVIDKLSMDGVNPSSCTVLFGGWHEYLAGSDFEMEVLSLSPEQEVGAYLRERGIGDLYSPYPKLSPRHIGYICKLIAERGVDIVHLHGYGAAHFGRVAARKCGIKNVVHEHAVLKIKPQHFLADWMLRNKTDVAVAVAGAVRDFMIKGRCIPPEKIRIIGNGADLNRFKPKTEFSRAAALEILGLGPDGPIIGTVTRFRREKGTEDLIRAFRDIRQQISGARLVVVGDGELRESLQELARDLEISDAVMWMGFRSDVEKLMPAFDIQVIPSWTEGYPLALAEAMAVGNAIVATEVGGMKEICSDNVQLLFAPPRSPPDIAQACTRLLRNPDLARRLAANAEVSADAMGIERNSRLIGELYSELLSG